jgi:hypothetical protein
VGDFVDGEEEILVGRSSDDVCGEEEGPREERCIPEEIGTDNLKAYHSSDERCGKRLRAT